MLPHLAGTDWYKGERVLEWRAAYFLDHLAELRVCAAAEKDLQQCH